MFQEKIVDAISNLCRRQNFDSRIKTDIRTTSTGHTYQTKHHFYMQSSHTKQGNKQREIITETSYRRGGNIRWRSKGLQIEKQITLFLSHIASRAPSMMKHQYILIVRLPKSLLDTTGIQAYKGMIPVSHNGLKCNLSWQWCASEKDINCKCSDQNIIRTQITKKHTQD